MSLFIPFNYQPSSVTVQTSSYTIPANKYAYVVIQAVGGASVTIDGATALTSRTISSGDVNGVNVENVGSDLSGTLFTVSSGYRFEGYLNFSSAGGTNTITVGGVETASDIAAGTRVEIKAADGQAISFTKQVTDDIHLTGYEIKEDKNGSTHNDGFWLPSGTVINGSGSWQATVMLFDEIS